MNCPCQPDIVAFAASPQFKGHSCLASSGGHPTWGAPPLPPHPPESTDAGREYRRKFWRPLDHRGGDISHQIALSHAYSRTIPCRLHRDFGNLTRLPHHGNFGGRS